MTRWPWVLAEIALYSLFAALAIWMALDARKRWRQLRERADTAAGVDHEHDQEHEHEPGSHDEPPGPS